MVRLNCSNVVLLSIGKTFQSFSAIIIITSLITIIGTATTADAVATNATCVMNAGSGVGNVTGTINFTQNDAQVVTISIALTGFPISNVTTKHGFHVHQSGNLSGSCNACGPHYNPYNVTHGDMTGTTSTRHVGDLGNINVINGASVITLTDNIIKLDGQYGIVNRSIVVHQLEDDLGKGNSTFSNTTGNAGGRLGCCTIVLQQSQRSSSPHPSHFISAFLLAVSAVSAFFCHPMLPF